MKIGNEYPVWWDTGKKVGDWYMANILDIKPYTGMFPLWYSKFLKLSAPSTKNGFLWMPA